MSQTYYLFLVCIVLVLFQEALSLISIILWYGQCKNTWKIGIFKKKIKVIKSNKLIIKYTCFKNIVFSYLVFIKLLLLLLELLAGIYSWARDNVFYRQLQSQGKILVKGLLNDVVKSKCTILSFSDTQKDFLVQLVK